MHTEVKSQDILKALAAFLSERVRPEVKDPKLSFQLLIAESLLAAVQLEGSSAAAEARAAELARLQKLTVSTSEFSKDETEIERLAAMLIAEVPAASEARLTDLRTHVATTLRADIEANNPRFSFNEKV
jgi:hypothetical protein